MYLDGIEYIYIERERENGRYCLRDRGEGEWIERQVGKHDSLTG